MSRLPCILGLALAACAAAFAQQDPGAAFKAIPVWPADDVAPADLKGQYVFLDRRAGQMVLVYPENLGQPGFEDNPGPRRVERFDLNNQVDAVVAVNVQRAGKYLTYSYRLANGRQARQAIRSFRVPAPQFASGDLIYAPANWNSAASPSKINAIRASIGRPAGVFLVWYPLDMDRAVAPGAQLDGFRVKTTLRPGLLVAYLQGGLNPALREEMPSEVLAQTVPLTQIEHNSQNVATIGPKFAADATPAMIAQDFHVGISKLVEQKALDGNSPVVRAALQGLERYQAGSGAQLVFEAQPQPGLESALVDAMMLSLDSR